MVLFSPDFIIAMHYTQVCRERKSSAVCTIVLTVE